MSAGRQPPRLAVLCATRRGCRFLERLADLLPGRGLLVFTFPEEPWEPPFAEDIRRLTLERGGELHLTRQVHGERWAPVWDAAPVDLLLAVSWRYLIPAAVYRRPRLGSFAFHDSLLPSYRGFAPTVWAIANGETHTGATLFEITDEMDAGPVVDQQGLPIGPDDTVVDVMERVTGAYLDLLGRNLEPLLAGTAPRRPQDPSQATYTCKRLPADDRIDWTAPAHRIHDLIRAVTAPYSGAFTTLEGRKLTLWSARRDPAGRRYVGAVPGRVVEILPGRGAAVLTGDGVLIVEQVQLEGGEVLPASEVLGRLSLTLGRPA